MTRTNDEIYEKVIQVHEKVVDLESQFVDLKRHVNDERDDMLTLIHGKLDRDSLPVELLKSLGFHALNNKYVRWGFGILALAVSTSATVQYWLPWADDVVRFIF